PYRYITSRHFFPGFSPSPLPKRCFPSVTGRGPPACNRIAAFGLSRSNRQAHLSFYDPDPRPYTVVFVPGAGPPVRAHHTACALLATARDRSRAAPLYRESILADVLQPAADGDPMAETAGRAARCGWPAAHAPANS